MLGHPLSADVDVLTSQTSQPKMFYQIWVLDKVGALNFEKEKEKVNHWATISLLDQARLRLVVLLH